ncbi:hypothetical protein [Vibrio splendidus]|uniref:hypothetical protein n=1 Tax=Vibrio splendidus TaxID=29497 RepID=UPI000C84EC46|nr:hypothetical protein [Vibrio splendidus]PMP40006.1 hypothetical protein BCS86_02550 [Vibrio splendidus]
MLNNKAQILLDKLLATSLSKGVQPHELAESVFDNDYLDFQVSKNEESLVVVFSFQEQDCSDKTVLHKMRYTYSLDKELQLVEQKVGRSNFTIQWSRENTLSTILEQLISLVGVNDLRKVIIEQAEDPIIASKLKLVA